MRTAAELKQYSFKQIQQLFSVQAQPWILAGNRYVQAHQAYLNQCRQCENSDELLLVLKGWLKLLRGFDTKSNRQLASLITIVISLLDEINRGQRHQHLVAAIERAVAEMQDLNQILPVSSASGLLHLTGIIKHNRASHYCLHVLKVIQQNIVNRRFFDQRNYHLEKPEAVPADEPVSPMNFGQPRIPSEKLFLKQPAIVYVSGGSHSFGPHGPGHSLLYLGTRADGTGAYVHTNSLYGHLEYMDDAEFKAYLEQYGKVVVGVQFVELPKRDFALKELRRLCNKKWWWGVAKHNCLDFAKKVLTAGGADLSSIESFLSLPTFNFQKVDNYQAHKSLFDSLSPSQVLKNTLVESIPMAYYSSAAQAKKLIDYVCSNMAKVMKWQMKLRKTAYPEQTNKQIKISSAYNIITYLEKKILTTKWKYASTAIFINSSSIFFGNKRKHKVRGYMRDMLYRIQQESRKEKPNWVATLNDVANIGLNQYQRKKVWYRRIFTGNQEQLFLQGINHSFLRLKRKTDFTPQQSSPDYYSAN